MFEKLLGYLFLNPGEGRKREERGKIRGKIRETRVRVEQAGLQNIQSHMVQ